MAFTQRSICERRNAASGTSPNGTEPAASRTDRSVPSRRANGRSVSSHKLAETAVASVRGQGHRVAYMPYTDDSGGVVVGGPPALS